MAHLANHKYTTAAVTSFTVFDKLGIVVLLRLSEMELQLEGVFQVKMLQN